MDEILDGSLASDTSDAPIVAGFLVESLQFLTESGPSHRRFEESISGAESHILAGETARFDQGSIKAEIDPKEKLSAS